MVIRTLLELVTLFRIRLRVDDINDISTEMFNLDVKLSRLREMCESLHSWSPCAHCEDYILHTRYDNSPSMASILSNAAMGTADFPSNSWSLVIS